MICGAQLYTVREYCKTPDDLALTLKKVADIGYATVQLSGVCAYEPEWMAEQLKANGLKCVITHYNPDKISGEPRKTVQDHLVYGCRHIGLGSAPGGLSDMAAYETFKQRFLPAAKCFRVHGALLMFHNHFQEFARDENGVTYMEHMMQDFKPDEMGFTLDTYWVQYSGADPAAWLRKLSGRVPCIHLKDMAIVNGQQRMAVVGEGNINFDSVLCAAEKAGTEYLLVEQDDCYGEDPFACLKRSYDNLKIRGLK